MVVCPFAFMEFQWIGSCSFSLVSIITEWSEFVEYT
jgi:hypothetical protein